MQFHLHLRKGDITVLDQEGCDCLNLAAAREEAVDAAREMMAQAVRGGWDVSDRCFEICDEGGAIQTRVPFGATIRKAGLIGDPGSVGRA